MKILVVDFETSGLNPNQHQVIEVGAVYAPMFGFGLTRAYSSFVRSDGAEIDPDALKVNKIQPEVLAGAPDRRQVFGKLSRWLQPEVTVVAHHAPFDLSFLDAELRRAGLPPWEGDFICTRTLSALLFPGVSHRLADMASLLGIHYPYQHRALADARVTLQLLVRLLPSARQHGIAYRNVLGTHPDRPLAWVPPRARLVPLQDTRKEVAE